MEVHPDHKTNHHRVLHAYTVQHSGMSDRQVLSLTVRHRAVQSNPFRYCPASTARTDSGRTHDHQYGNPLTTTPSNTQ